jgi:spore coat polysaccharide biosynthesis protein SpsF (cytidylyltransferase family)
VRRLVAALACRVGGARLYGKPLQNLAADCTILDQILDTMAALAPIDGSVLGISEGVENLPFVTVAKRRNILYVVGSEKDVLWRLILCGRMAAATDVFRITTECPFLYHEALAEAWKAHVEHGNDVTATDALPEGTHFEIYRLSALEASHERGSDWHRSEGCSRYIREHRDQFKVETILPPPDCRRLDLRLTVDYPEDLVLCRRVFEAFRAKAPLIRVSDITRFLDSRPDLKALVEPYVKPMRLWPIPGEEVTA